MAKRKKQEDIFGGDDTGVPEDAVTSPDEAELSPSESEAAPDAEFASSRPPTENYVVLARRYRPQTFNEIVAQEQVQSGLRGAIAGGQIAHAYLFSGPRGTGKTSTARILAKALNCQNGGPRPDPCGKCESCRAIAAGSSLDVIEIDAASNTGVDNIRDLRSGVALAPFSRFKVYIVDEVHMLSMQAFNALLKTLEEPPPQVVFVLATTELHKVPETIVSRCQSYAFRRFTVPEIAKQLGRIFDIEVRRRGLTVEPEERERILDLLARNAEGGMRDAQVGLDQVLVLSHEKVEFEAVRRFLGSVRIDVLDRFIRGLYQRETAELLSLIDELVNGGQDLERFAKNFAEELRDLLVARTAPQKPELLNVSPDRYQNLQGLAGSLPVGFLLNVASAFLRLADEMKMSTQSRFLLEYTVIRLTQVDPVEDVGKIIARLQDLERRIGGGVSGGGGVAAARETLPAASPAPASRPVTGSDRGTLKMELLAQDSPVPVEVSEPPVRAPVERVSHSMPKPGAEPRPEAKGSLTAAPEPAPAVSDQVISPEPNPGISAEEFLGQLRERTVARNNHYLHITLLETCIVSLSETTAVLGINPADRFTFDHLNRPQNQSTLRELAREITGRDLTIRTQFHTVQAGAGPMPAAVSSVAHPSPPPSGSVAQVKESEGTDAAAAASPAMMTGGGPEPESLINYSQELIEATAVVLKGDALKQFLEKHADVKEVFQKVKDAFKVDDSQITYRYRTI
jgi:DNA polymerase III subunit gamma/tau